MLSTSGIGLSKFLESCRPSFVWDPYRPTHSYRGVDFTVEDIDVIGNEPFTVWDSSNERFKFVYPSTQPNEVLGSIGDFSDGKVQSWWSSYWTSANLGFSVSNGTPAGYLGQLAGTAPDILDTILSMDVTYVDTDESNDSFIERSQNRSATYARVLQVLVKSVDSHSAVDNVEIGFNTSAGTGTTSSDTWSVALPGSRGWYAVMFLCPTGGSPIYVTMKFKVGTGRWLLAAPSFYSQWSTMENIVRAPMPKFDATYYNRGQYQVLTTNEEFAIPVSGWLAQSIILPDRSISNGHLDYSGAAAQSFAGMFSWLSGTYRIRTIMSSSSYHLGVQLDNGGTSFAYLDLGDDWVDFEKIGLVVTWGISNGSEFANLYVNGKKYDAVFGPSDWFPNNLAASTIYIGADGDGGAAADCWINKVALGRKPLHRSKARELSLYMRNSIRTGTIGEM
jgi:hypothetical protein